MNLAEIEEEQQEQTLIEETHHHFNSEFEDRNVSNLNMTSPDDTEEKTQDEMPLLPG